MTLTTARTSLIGGLLTVLLFAAPSQAITIDFTDASAWSGANGTTSFTSATTYDGVSVQLLSSLPMTFNAGDVNGTCAAVTGLACDGDGIGIGDDEVTYGLTEIVSVLFSQPVNVDGIGFLDLFGVNALTGDASAETAEWLILFGDGTSVFGALTGTDTTTRLGYKTLGTSYQNVTQIFFGSGTTQDVARNSDFALASLAVSVPEPATLLLFGVGLAATSALRRRRAA